MKKNKISVKNILLLTVAGIINSIGVTVFLAPVGLYDSGVSGTSMLLSRITPEFLTLSVFLVILNVPLFLYGLKRQGFVFTVYAIYSVLIYSLSAWAISLIFPAVNGVASPIAGTDLLLCSLFGGIISGIGSGLAIRFGGAMDGIEVMAVIFAKRLGITVGTFVMLYNVVLYLICGIIYRSWQLPLYSVIAYGAALKAVDFIVEGIDRSKAVFIVTIRPDEVCEVLSKEFEQGVTIMDAKGYYSDSSKSVVYFVLNRFQVGKMKELVRSADPAAYISINDVADVYKANQ